MEVGQVASSSGSRLLRVPACHCRLFPMASSSHGVARSLSPRRPKSPTTFTSTALLPRVFLMLPDKELDLLSYAEESGRAPRSEEELTPRRSMAGAAQTSAAKEKVFVALPADVKAGRSTLSWALRHFGDSGATIVIAHVHAPPQMIPVMGVKFCASKLNPEQVTLFRMIEREKVNKLLDDYVHQCLKMKVKCEKLVFEKEDVIAGLLELIAFHGVTKLAISAAADRHYSRKMDKPKSRTAAEIMQRADSSCKIWFVCKEQLICTRSRDKEVEIAPAITSLLPEFDHDVLHLSPHREEDDIELELGFYDELKEACKAAENLMNRALKETSRRQEAEEEVVSSLHKAKEYEELYLEEVNKRKELEGALVRANREIEQLRQAVHLPKQQQNTTMEELQEAITKKLILEQSIIDMNVEFGAVVQLIGPQQKYVQTQLDHDNGARELETPLNQRKLTAFSPSSVIPSPFNEDCVPSYFVCPIFQEIMRKPYIAADGFTYEVDAIRGWLDGGHEISPMTGQPLAHRELTPNFALRSVIQDYIRRHQYPFP